MLSTLKNTHLLLIEDNIECAETSIRLLNNFIANIFHAIDSATAFAYMKTHRIDFIICDIHLNQTENGLDLIESIREKNINIPIIVISGFQDTHYLLRSIPLNLTAYIVKPINFDSLLEALFACCKKLNLTNDEIDKILVKDNLFYDPVGKVLLNEISKYELNKKEILFIQMIIQMKHNIITKDMFYAYVWEYEEMSNAALKNFILRLRKRFGKEFIQTVKNIGYRI